MAEGKPSKVSIWDQALRAVRGDSTSELVEQFTQEMTLVAEGLCEDQARLRRAVDGLTRQAERGQSRISQDVQALEQRLDEMERRLSFIEGEMERRRSRGAWRRLISGDGLARVTLLAGVVCGTVLIVAVLKLFI